MQTDVNQLMHKLDVKRRVARYEDNVGGELLAVVKTDDGYKAEVRFGKSLPQMLPVEDLFEVDTVFVTLGRLVPGRCSNGKVVARLQEPKDLTLNGWSDLVSESVHVEKSALDALELADALFISKEGKVLSSDDSVCEFIGSVAMVYKESNNSYAVVDFGVTERELEWSL
jgi:hypothetical protein